MKQPTTRHSQKMPGKYEYQFARSFKTNGVGMSNTGSLKSVCVRFRSCVTVCTVVLCWVLAVGLRLRDNSHKRSMNFSAMPLPTSMLENQIHYENHKNLPKVSSNHSKTRLMEKEEGNTNLRFNSVHFPSLMMNNNTRQTQVENGEYDIKNRGIGRVLLYMTTFPKVQHLQIIQECWPLLIRQSTLLSRADVLVFLGGEVTPAFLSEWKEALRHLPVNATLHYDPLNPGYQQGSMRAVNELFQNGWAQDYDWVIRINPDVLIYDDTDLLALMSIANQSVSAVLCNCDMTQDTLSQTNTDFFAVRPSAILANSFADWSTFPNAEKQATRAFASIVQENSSAWILTHNKWEGLCRVRGNGLWHGHDSCAAVLNLKPWQRLETLSASRNLSSSQRPKNTCPTPYLKLLKFVNSTAGGYVC